MSCITYSNNGTLFSAIKVDNESFHRRLKQLYPCVEDVSKLPQTWSPDSKAPLLGLSVDNLGCYFRGNGRRDEDEKFAAAVRTDHYIPPSCLLYYFEIKFVSKGREGLIGLGLSSAQALLTKLPGWSRESYGFQSDDGQTFNGDGKGRNFGPSFTSGDVIGCGYNLVKGKCFFTKNGCLIANAFKDIPGNIPFYPAVGLKTAGEEIRANFGQEKFEYDIEEDIRSLKKKMTRKISNYPVPDFGIWQCTVHKLVQTWLLENSYPNTAETFSKSAKIECKENIQRIEQRHCVQKLVLSGKISEAIKLTNCLCPDLLKNNPNLFFALKCRQFIELLSGAESDYQPTIFNYANQDNQNNHTNSQSTNSNGVSSKMKLNGDQLEQDENTATKNNGCNGMIRNNNNCVTKTEDQQSTSSASLQELMEIDQPANLTSANENHNHPPSPTDSSSSVSSTDSTLNPTLPRTRTHTGKVKMETNSRADEEQPAVDTDMEVDEQKYAKLLQFGRELSDHLEQIEKIYGKNEANEKMLQDTISLIAFTNPRKSSFGKLLDATEREPLSQLLNSSIVKAEKGDTHRPPLEEVVNHLRKLVKLNHSGGRWLLDKLY